MIKHHPFKHSSTVVLLLFPLTKDTVKEVHEHQHPTHHGHKDDHFQRRVEKQISTVSLVLSTSCTTATTLQPLSVR